MTYRRVRFILLRGAHDVRLRRGREARDGNAGDARDATDGGWCSRRRHGFVGVGVTN